MSAEKWVNLNVRFSKVEKVLRDGQVFIIRNGNTYDLTGRKQESSK